MSPNLEGNTNTADQPAPNAEQNDLTEPQAGMLTQNHGAGGPQPDGIPESLLDSLLPSPGEHFQPAGTNQFHYPSVQENIEATTTGQPFPYPNDLACTQPRGIPHENLGVTLQPGPDAHSQAGEAVPTASPKEKHRTANAERSRRFREEKKKQVDQLARDKQDLEVLNQSLSEELSARDKRLAVLEEQIAALRKRNSDMLKEADTLVRYRSGLENVIEDLKEKLRLAIQETAASPQEQNNSDNQRRIEQLKSRIKSLEKENEDLKYEKELSETARTAYLERIRKLEYDAKNREQGEPSKRQPAQEDDDADECLIIS